MLEISYPLTISDNLNYGNIPLSIIVLDSRNTPMTLSNMDMIHKSFGLKMFGYHYYITQQGEVLGGRPERAFACNVEALMKNMYNLDSGNNFTPQLDNIMSNNIMSANKIFVCIEANTDIAPLTNAQTNSLIALGQDIMSRYRNIRNIYSLQEYLPKIKNLGSFVDMNNIRSEVNKVTLKTYVDLPSGSISYTFGKRKLYYDSESMMSGNDIKALQVYLNAIGVPCETTNGKYDVVTYKAVQSFQRLYSLPVTGEMMKNDYLAIVQAVESLNYKQDFSKYYRYLRVDRNHYYSGDDVTKLQNQLVNLHLMKANQINGKYDETTSNIIATYQKNNGYEVTGEVGPIDWKRIMGSKVVRYSRVIKFTEPLMSGEDVLFIQKVIDKVKIKFNITITSLSGQYDQTTKNNVTKIQMMSNLAMTGIVDQQTWNLIEQYA